MKKTLIIYHRVDYDGVFSSCIAEKFTRDNGNNCSILGYTYGDPVPDIGSFIMGGINEIIIVDITLPVCDMIELYNYQKNGLINVTWIDHHITSINDSINNGYSEINGIRDLEKAACEYTWEYFYPNTITPPIIEFLSAFDVWNKARFDWDGIVYPIQLALKARYGVNQPRLYEYFVNHLVSLSEKGIKSELVRDGRLIQMYTERTWKVAAKLYSFDITIAGEYRGICMLSTEFTSSIFQSIQKDYDICCVANKRGDDIYCCSLYIDQSKGLDFNAGEYLRENYGGGGHKCAAGCTLTEDQFKRLIFGKEL